MLKMVKSKFRLIFLFLCVCTVCIVLYKSLYNDRAYNQSNQIVKTNDKYSHMMMNSNNNNNNNNKMYELNELMPLTQSRDNVETMRRHEKQMLDNVQKMIHHKMSRHQLNAQPSLWSGMEQPVVAVPEMQRASFDRNNLVILDQRFVHLDLKGAAPKLSYFKQLFPFLVSLGVTGLLIEYEDTFPYSGMLEVARAWNSYTEDEIREILKIASEHRLEVIPLIQAFGHLEFVLKSEQYQGLREVPAYPQAICPSNNMTLVLLREMVDQVLRLHPRAKYLHIGCDEVYNLGECYLCQERLSKMGWNTGNLFLAHVSSITRYIKTKHNVQPIVWDDMMRKLSEEAILALEMGKYADILVWKYSSEVESAIEREVWDKYSRCFEGGIWIASAFKGADYPSSVSTPIQDRLDNHESWMKLVQKYRNISFKGVFLTGWQRYDHFGALCELLPAGLPSLAVNLHYLINLSFNFSDARAVQTVLGCNRPVPMSIDVANTDISCSFPGSKIYELALNFNALKFHVEEQFFKSNFVTGWLTPFNVNNRFSSPALLEQATYRYGDGVRNMTLFHSAMSEALSLVYDPYTVNEWLEINVKPIVDRLERYYANIRLLMAKNSWSRRPLNWQTKQDETAQVTALKNSIYSV